MQYCISIGDDTHATGYFVAALGNELENHTDNSVVIGPQLNLYDLVGLSSSEQKEVTDAITSHVLNDDRWQKQLPPGDYERMIEWLTAFIQPPRTM